MENKNLLIIDDDYFIRKLIEILLNDKGFNFLQANDTEEAKYYLEQFEIDVITCDIILPNSDGLKFLKWLKSSHYESIPVILITAVQLQGQDQDLLNEMSCCIINKPFKEFEILSAVEKALMQI